VLANTYFINGVFFQDQEWLSLDCVAIEGNVVVIKRGLCRFIFSGIIEPTEETVLGSPVMVGRTMDQFGMAHLTNISLSDDRLSFVKKYDNRKDLILYSFAREDEGLWIGEYDGELTGKGSARCVLTPVPDQMFASTVRPPLPATT